MITEQESTSISDAYSLFLDAMNSPVTGDRYTTSTNEYFSLYVGIEGKVKEQCRIFIEKSDKDNQFVFKSIISFLQTQKAQIDRKGIYGSTIRNYLKAIKLFTEMNDISISWKKITRGLPKGRKWVDDRAPTLDEIRKIVEYPDRRSQ